MSTYEKLPDGYPSPISTGLASVIDEMRKTQGCEQPVATEVCPECGTPRRYYFNGMRIDCDSRPCQQRKADEQKAHDVAKGAISVMAKIPPAFQLADQSTLSVKLPEEPGSLLFTGPGGRGKTHSAAAYAIKLAKAGRIQTMHWTTVPMFLLRVRSTFGERAKESEMDVVKELINKPDLLILDDLGAEKVTDFSLSTLYCVISERDAMSNKPTVVTTNLRNEELYAYEPRIASRLSAWKRIRIDGKDWRARED